MSAHTFDIVMQVLGKRFLGSNERSEYGGTRVSLPLWSSGPRLMGTGKFPRWKRPLSFLFFFRGHFLDGHLGSVYMTPCATLFKARGI